MSPVPKTVDEYIAAASEDMRPGLERLRKAIRGAAPKADEGISYQMPTYKYYGMLVSFGAWKNHLALYGASGSLVAAHKAELAAYDTSKGTIRFSPDKPVPVTLVKKLVKARVAENEEAERKREEKRRHASKR